MRLLPCLRALPYWFAFTALAQQPPPPAPPEFRFPELAPVVQAAAEKQAIPASGFDAFVARTEVKQGDKVVALVDHLDGKKHKQWLVLLAPRILTAEERALPPLKEARMYLSTGHVYDYTGQLAAIAIRCLGPYSFDANNVSAPKRVKDQWSGALVNDAFLGLGFDEMCRLLVRVNDVCHTIGDREKREVTFSLNSGSAPFPADQVANTRRALAPFDLVDREERALAGSVLALLGFFDVALRTPGLDDVLASVTDIPWFSILRHGGRMPQININYLPPVRVLSPEEWGLPTGTPLYAQPFLLDLNGKPALRCQLAVLAPRPPFLASAGIVGIAAQRPDGKGPQLSIRVIAARLAPEEPPATPPVAADHH